MIVGLGTMFTCYQHVPGRDGIHFSYLILEGPFAVFYLVVSPQNSILIASVLLAIMILYFMEQCHLDPSYQHNGMHIQL